MEHKPTTSTQFQRDYAEGLYFMAFTYILKHSIHPTPNIQIVQNFPFSKLPKYFPPLLANIVKKQPYSQFSNRESKNS